MIPVENNCELMDRLYDFLAPTLEQEDLFLIRSPVCLTLDVRAYMLMCCGACGPFVVRNASDQSINGVRSVGPRLGLCHHCHHHH